MPVELRRGGDGLIGLTAKHEADESKLIQGLMSGRASRMIMPLNHEMPSDWLTARLLAKISIEIMACRTHKLPNWEEFMVDDPQLDPIRRFARIGDVPTSWPISIRKIYDENACHQADANSWQVLHEFDLLLTEQSELYGVVCIFGLEFAINIGGPEIDGYHHWLSQHSGRSPLYQDSCPP